MDGCEIHFAPPKKPWNDDSPVNTNKQWCTMVSKWCGISSIHSTFGGELEDGSESFLQAHEFHHATSRGPSKQPHRSLQHFPDHEQKLEFGLRTVILFSPVGFKGNLSLLDIFSFFPGDEKANGGKSRARFRFGDTHPWKLCPPPYLLNLKTLLQLRLNLFWVDDPGCQAFGACCKGMLGL